jgi:hypothetical protein
LALTLSSFKGGEVMSNIYWMNTIRRKQNTGSGKKYFDFRFDYHAIMWFWGNTEQSHPFDGDDGLSIVVGAQKNELYNSPGAIIEPITGKARNNGQYSFRTIVDPESYQYIFFPITYTDNATVNQFIDLFTSDNETSCGLEVPRIDIRAIPRLKYDICLQHFIEYGSRMTLYPYLLEYTQQGETITNRILKTYSFISPNQHITSRTGNEPVKLGIGNEGISITLDELRVSRSNYRSMLSNIWSNYTAQLPQPSYTQFGFMGIARGNTPSSLTPKNSIKWFLQRVTDVDINTQWTHAQLS